MLPNDSSLTPEQYKKVRMEASRALDEAGVKGVFPTPVEAVMRVANVTEVKDNVLDATFVNKLRDNAGIVKGVLKTALSKVLGIFHAPSGLVYIDRNMLEVKQRFVGFHEAGHGFMPWQRAMYSYVEASQLELASDAADLFDREANIFATEVLFQLDTLQERTAGSVFSIYTATDIASEFGASKYATIRQYVSKNQKACVVIVLNKPIYSIDGGYSATVRRTIASASFKQTFGNYICPNQVTSNDDIGAMIPLAGNRSSGQRHIALVDLNGVTHECIAESFTNTYQVFVLIHSVGTLRKPAIIMPTTTS